MLHYLFLFFLADIACAVVLAMLVGLAYAVLLGVMRILTVCDHWHDKIYVKDHSQQQSRIEPAIVINHASKE
jgi:hypothetical protein